jgi:hypothetical protein
MEMRTTQQAARSVLLLVLATLLFASGCTLVKSESDVLGEYELKVGKGKLELKILPDRSFSETIFWPTRSTEWGLRSNQDDPDSDSWGGQNVFDVYTKSEGTGLDGKKYKDW